ncbi:transporter [Planctomycetaceae bacterium SCGC AG-212-F19]|nr:transporter [Planctomycetaceae bacterium SCGC AG-212-F19]
MISHFFIDRPIFASVLSIIVVLAGAVALLALPVTLYPEVAPPTVMVTASYPGANATTVRDTVAVPIEAQVSGVEGMLYMASQCTNDGAYTLTITFKLGTDSDMAQVLVQNRVTQAQPVIPSLVLREGITVKKTLPTTLMMVNLIAPDGRYDATFLSNYATIQIRDELSRLPGVANVTLLGQRDYSMRVWLDPEKLAALSLSAADIIQSISQQNLQVPAGQIGQEPVPQGQQFQLTINTLGRLVDPEQFGAIIMKADTRGASDTSVGIVRLRDVARVELGAQQYGQTCTLDGHSSVALSVYQLPNSNALQTARGIYAKMAELKSRFPEGLDYQIAYDTTPFVRESVDDVFKTLGSAVLLVAVVVLVFLQNWRAALIPLIAVPVGIIGTFAVLLALGYSLNSLSLFGLVLAIGIVVDDAIVVVENVERWLEKGLPPREAARRAMEEVSGPVIAIALILSAVFLPCMFIGGITGQFFRQFAVTIAVSTLLSAFNSLTLSPALAAVLLRPRDTLPDHLTRLLEMSLGWFFRRFNRTLAAGTTLYTRLVGGLLRVSLLALLIYVGLLVLTYRTFTHAPVDFVPEEDKGYLLLNVQLPDAASVERTRAVMTETEALVRTTPGVAHTVGISGRSLLQNANGPNLGSMYVMLEGFARRRDRSLSAAAIAVELRQRCREKIRGGLVTVLGAPAIDGLGATGGYTLVLEDRANLGLEVLQHASDRLIERGNRTDGLEGLFDSARVDTPWLYLDIDRTKCQVLGVALADVFQTLEANFGSYYVNNFNEFGRTWQVNVMAGPRYRTKVRDLLELWVRNREGQMVPLGTLMQVRTSAGPALVQRYNMYAATMVTGRQSPGTSSTEAVRLVEEIAVKELPAELAYDWTGLTFLQLQAGDTALYVFALAVVFVFLVLAGQYESWTLPLAVILVVPMCLLCSLVGVGVAGADVTIFTQIGFVVLVGLACKNAILIVEFARQQQDGGAARREAILEACRLRLRPILMTSIAFIVAVVPLVFAQGAGAEMRHSLGVAVFGGMLGVTLFGIFLTPVFYHVLQRESGSPRLPPSK